MHNGVLAANSPVFSSMFVHGLRERESSIIQIEDMSLEECSALADYFYGILKYPKFWKNRLTLLAPADRYLSAMQKKLDGFFNIFSCHSSKYSIEHTSVIRHYLNC